MSDAKSRTSETPIWKFLFWCVTTGVSLNRPVKSLTKLWQVYQLQCVEPDSRSVVVYCSITQYRTVITVFGVPNPRDPTVKANSYFDVENLTGHEGSPKASGTV